MALLFDLDQLIDMMSIGTLLAYTIVAICVLVLRYQDEDMSRDITIRMPTVLKQLLNRNSYREPNILSSAITKVGIVIFAIMCLVWCGFERLYDITSTEGIISLSVVGVVLIIILLIIAVQPVSTIELTFKVPMVPFIPCLSVFVNLYLMFQLDVYTWIRFLVWIVLGYIIYFWYGIRNSTQISRNRNHAEAAMNMQRTNEAFEPDWKSDKNGYITEKL